jgi:hypothetical protein
MKSFLIGLMALIIPLSEGASMEVKEIRQDGLKALMSEDHTVPVVSLRMVFDGGKRLVPEVKKYGPIGLLFADGRRRRP